jgi:hypothetical protein
LSYNINVPVKYDIDFDRIADNNRHLDEQVFNTAFNNPASTRKYGNNDFIELRSGDDDYLYPQIDGIQSNGIWFTKARSAS